MTVIIGCYKICVLKVIFLFFIYLFVCCLIFSSFLLVFGAGTLRTASQNDVPVGGGTRIEDKLPTEDISRLGDGTAIGGNRPTEDDVSMGDSGAIGGTRPAENDKSMGDGGAMGSNRPMEDDAPMGDGGATEDNRSTGNDASMGDDDSMGETRPTEDDAPMGERGAMEGNRSKGNDTSIGDDGSNDGNRHMEDDAPMGDGGAMEDNRSTENVATVGDGGATGGNRPTEVDTPSGDDTGSTSQEDSTEGDSRPWLVLCNLNEVILTLGATLSDSGVDSDYSSSPRPRKRLRLHAAGQIEKDETLSDGRLGSNKSSQHGATIPRIRSKVPVSTPRSSLAESSSPNNELSTPLDARNSTSVVTPLRVKLSKSLKSLISMKRRSVSSRKNSTRKKISGVPRKHSVLFFGKRKSSKGRVKRVVVGVPKASSPKLPVSPPSPRLDEDGLEIIAPTLYTLNVFNRKKKKLNVRLSVVFLFFFSVKFFFYQSSGVVTFASISFKWLDRESFCLTEDTVKLKKWRGLVGVVFHLLRPHCNCVFFFFCLQETAFESALYLQRLCPRSLVDNRRSVPVSSGSTVTSIRLKTYKELLLADGIRGAVLEFSLDTWTSFSFAKRNSLFSRHNIVVRGGAIMHKKFSLGSELMKLTLNYSAERQAHGMCNCSCKYFFNILIFISS